MANRLWLIYIWYKMDYGQQQNRSLLDDVYYMGSWWCQQELSSNSPHRTWIEEEDRVEVETRNKFSFKRHKLMNRWTPFKVPLYGTGCTYLTLLDQVEISPSQWLRTEEWLIKNNFVNVRTSIPRAKVWSADSHFSNPGLSLNEHFRMNWSNENAETELMEW